MPDLKIAPCLWFDGNAEDAARYYTAHLPDARIDAIVRAPADTPGGAAGDVLTVTFTIAGQSFVALNGGPHGAFNEAISFQIYCDDQAEADRMTAALSAHPESEQCGWVKDRFGVSWQIVPRRMIALLGDADPDRARRAMAAMLTMKRIDIAAIERAANGELT